MSAFAPVAPPKLLLDLKKKGVLGNYHLLLAHDVAANESLYKEIFGDMKDTYIIMDNSLIELGYPAPIETIQKACEIVKASVVVLPDKLNDMKWTIKSTSEAIFKWHEEGLGPFMAVLQGRTITEMLNCATQLSKLPWIESWGIPRCAVDAVGSRWGILQEIIMRNDGKRIHLLGFSDDMADDISCARHFRVAGIDSAVPLRLGFYEIPFSPSLKSTPPRGDYFEKTEATQMVIDNLEVVRKWLAR